MPRRLNDLSVVVKEYTDNTGQQRKEYKNVGVEMEADDGGRYLLLDRSFNPAGIPNPQNRSNLIINFYEPKPKGDN
ncbi:MAG: hypothetical protein ACPGO7_02750 [Alphaproteobacteria bacterium]